MGTIEQTGGYHFYMKGKTKNTKFQLFKPGAQLSISPLFKLNKNNLYYLPILQHELQQQHKIKKKVSGSFWRTNWIEKWNQIDAPNNFHNYLYKSFFKGWWHLVAFMDHYTHLYEIVRCQHAAYAALQHTSYLILRSPILRGTS